MKPFPFLEWHSLRADDGALCLTIALHGDVVGDTIHLEAKTAQYSYRATRSVTKGDITLFELSIPFQAFTEEDTLTLVLIEKGRIVPVAITTSHFFPLNEHLHQAYCILGGYCIMRMGQGLRLRRRFRAWQQELRLCSEILCKCRKRRFESLFTRLLLAFRKRVNARPLWLLMDRPQRADDNTEAFALYLKQQHPEIKIRFVLNRDSLDWKRLQNVFPLVSYGSRRHRILSALAQVYVCSDAIRPSWYYAMSGLQDHFALQPFVFLQHGVTNNNMSQWLWKYNQNIAGFVTSWERECQHILAGAYGYRASQVWLTGFSRFDRLYDATKGGQKRITIMPTWRHWLMEGYDAKRTTWTLKANFEASEYYQFWNAFLNHPRLHQLAQAHHCEIAFLMHPVLQSAKAVFTAPNVTFLPADSSYREAYAKSNCVITDYSSAVFDFAYLQKPILYAQFDQKRFFSGEHTYVKGDFFDHERDGFGEVTTTLDETLDALAKILSNDCQMDALYIQRLHQTFPALDQSNSDRIYTHCQRLLNCSSVRA